jgi:hypothetical protein
MYRLFILYLLFTSNYAFCQSVIPFGYEEIHGNIFYKVFSNNKNKAMPNVGDYIRMSLCKKDIEGKELFNTDFFGDPYGVEIQLDTPKYEGDVMEFYTKLHEGDSAIIYIPCYIIEPQKSWNNDDYFVYHIQLHYVYPLSEYLLTKENNAKQQFKTDSLKIADYLVKKDISKYIRDSSGVVIVKKGKKKPENISKDLCVHYKGIVLEGKLFDESYTRNTPFCFKTFNNEVIKGWDIGLSYFKKKQKGTIILPSCLAYGEKGNGNDIPPNAVLLFEVELVKK